jgi:hypothetical protein
MKQENFSGNESLLRPALAGWSLARRRFQQGSSYEVLWMQFLEFKQLTADLLKDQQTWLIQKPLAAAAK